MDVTAFIDLPLTLAAEDDEPTSRIQVAQLGRFSDPRYGNFAITREQVANWTQLLHGHFGGEIPIDRDHDTDRGGSSEAMGWITSLDQKGPDGASSTPNAVWAVVRWTKAGADLIRSKAYRKFSPTFVSNLKNAAGDGLGPALLRGALTNNPFLHDMPAINLDGGAIRVGDAEPEAPADTQGMPLTKDVATKLGVAEDADEATILAKIDEITKPPKTDEVVNLDAAAAAEGKLVLSAEDVTKLRNDAAQGVEAAKTLSEQRFTLAFDSAQKAGKLDAKPETKVSLKAFYDANPDEAIKYLDSLPVIVNLSGSGGQGTQTQEDGEAPEGVDPDSYELDQKVRAYMLEHKLPDDDYVAALDAVRTLEA